jgi:hypothetical protein
MAQGSSVFDASGDAARITSSEITMPSQSFTCVCWFKRTADKTGDYEAFISLRGSSHILIRMDSTNSWNNLASGSAVDLTGALPTGAWFALAVSANASNTKVYWYNSAGTLVSSNTTGAAPTSFNADDLTLGNDNEANESRNIEGKISLGRVWNVALSQAQIEAELASSTAVVTSGLLAKFEDDPAAATPSWTESSLTLDGADYPTLPYSGGGSSVAPLAANYYYMGAQ